MAAALAVPAMARGASQAGEEGVPFARVQYALDGSGSMRARFGGATKFEAAREMLQMLEDRLARADGAPEPALWAYGARSHRLQRDCTDAELLARGRRGSLERLLAGLAPRGVSPLVHALDGMLASAPPEGQEAWVIFTDGSDTCGRDPCEWAARALARPARLRIYVVGLALESEDVRQLRCLTEPTSGYVVNVQANATWEPQLARLAAVIRNRGSLRVDLAVRETEGFDVQGRVFRVGADAPLRAIRTGQEEELPGGIYRVVVETLPPTVFERVLILPGAELVLTVEDLGRLLVRSLSPTNDPIPAYAGLSAEGSDEEHFFPAGRAVYVRAGSYRLSVEIADSVALSRTLDVARGELHTVSVGGTGFVRARAPGLPRLAGVEVELQEYASGRSSAVRPWRTSVAVPAGEYRAVVRSLPIYVQERFTVAPAETSMLVVPGLGTLQVELSDSAGRPLSVPVTLLRPEGPAAGAAEPAPGAVIGKFLSGVKQAVLPGTYDLLLEMVPSRLERGIRIEPGVERVVTVAVPARGGGEGT